jgi:hypothetical protein
LNLNIFISTTNSYPTPYSISIFSIIFLIFLFTKSYIFENSLLMYLITTRINLESSSFDFSLKIEIRTSFINSGPFKISELSLNELSFLKALFKKNLANFKNGKSSGENLNYSYSYNPFSMLSFTYLK